MYAARSVNGLLVFSCSLDADKGYEEGLVLSPYFLLLYPLAVQANIFAEKHQLHRLTPTRLRTGGHHHGKLLVREHETPGEPPQLRCHAALDADGEDVRRRGYHRRHFGIAQTELFLKPSHLGTEGKKNPNEWRGCKNKKQESLTHAQALPTLPEAVRPGWKTPGAAASERSDHPGFRDSPYNLST